MATRCSMYRTISTGHHTLDVEFELVGEPADADSGQDAWVDVDAVHVLSFDAWARTDGHEPYFAALDAAAEVLLRIQLDAILVELSQV